MSTMFRPRLDILPSVQKTLWPKLKPLADLGFVLYGGTAIALRLGHRDSVDFDFFTERPLDRTALQEALPCLRDAEVLQDQPDTISFMVPVGDDGQSRVKVSFFCDIHFGRVGEPEWTDDATLLVASMDDLMATKVKVVLQRVEAKDYRDIAAMVQSGVSLGRGLASARQLYGRVFQPAESLRVLVYFDGGDLETLSVAECKVLIDAASTVQDLPGVPLASRVLTSDVPRPTPTPSTSKNDWTPPGG